MAAQTSSFTDCCSVTFSPELCSLDASMRRHCLILEGGPRPQFSRKDASATRTLSRRFVPSRSGCVAALKVSSTLLMPTVFRLTLSRFLLLRRTDIPRRDVFYRHRPYVVSHQHKYLYYLSHMELFLLKFFSLRDKNN